MGQLADTQEKVRNKGWRIQRIRGKKGWKAEWVHNTLLSLLLAALGLVLFLSPIILVFLEKIPKPAVLFAVLGLGVLLLSRLIAARSQFRGWIPIQAECLDRESRKRKRKSGGKQKWVTRWQFRVLCRFSHNGETVETTPECYGEFSSERALNDYLSETIAADGTCQIYFDPNNPLRSVFHKPPTFVDAPQFVNA